MWIKARHVPNKGEKCSQEGKIEETCQVNQVMGEK
jgi:hypothetical protein